MDQFDNYVGYTVDVVSDLTERANEVLHMILDLKMDKEVDLYHLQSLVLSMYNDEVQFAHHIAYLTAKIEEKKRKDIDVPKFMFKNREAQ